jgi:hypothetical protein
MALAFDSLDLPPAEVERRFRWARRRGKPAWLWPEIARPDWRSALAAIERAAADALAGRRAILGSADPEAIGLAGYTSGMGPLLGWWIERGSIAADPLAADLLALHLQHNRIRAERMRGQAVGVAEALADRGIAVALLKGAHSAQAFFPDPGARPASDIDLLVRPDGVASAEAVLAALGLAPGTFGGREASWHPPTPQALPRSLRLLHAEDAWSIDLHWSLDVTAGGGAPVAQLDLGEPMASAARWEPSPGAMVLEQPLLLLYLAAHAGAGLQNLTLLRLTELAFVIRKQPPDWNGLLAAGERTGALGYAWPALSLCEALAPGSVPAPVLEAMARHAPPAVRRIVARLTPATAQRVDRASLAEHFMWVPGWRGRMRQLAADLVPSPSWAGSAAIYRRRAWQLLRGGVSR